MPAAAVTVARALKKAAVTQEARARAHACDWQRRQCREGLGSGRAAAAQAVGNQGSAVA